MIFVTVGSMFPFDRMIRAADEWAAAHAGAEDVLAQIGEGSFEPRHMRWVRRLDQDAFAETAAAAELIVAHAGMGSVIMAGQHGKPIVILPRLKSQGEHNTDHQVATANWLRSRPGVFVAAETEDLAPQIDAACAAQSEEIMPISTAAPEAFLAFIRETLKK